MSESRLVPTEMLALVLGGGNALGAFHGGVIEALGADGTWPEWIAGSSIGGIMAAILAGNPPERRVEAARAFWSRAAAEDMVPSWMPDSMRRAVHLTSALGARVAGRPRLYSLRLAGLLLDDRRPGLYDRGPMRRLVAELVDFERLNSGDIRVSVLAVDAETGAEVTFDTAHTRLDIDHLMASSALIPDFQPVEIGGRLLADGGLAANVPADLVLAEPAGATLACFAVDLYPRATPRPARLTDAAERQSDLMFACQTARTLRAMQLLWQGRASAGAVYAISYPFEAGEVAMKTYDFTRSSIDRRWRRGRDAMADALRLWRASPPAAPGLVVHEVAGLPGAARP